MNLLTRREHSFVELKNKLAKRDFSSDEVNEVLIRLQDEKLLSDERFTENYIRYRQNRGFGPIRISNELRERGVSDDLIQMYLDMNDPNWKTLAKDVWQKRFDTPPQDHNERAKHSRFLWQRGFTQEQISSLFD